MTSAFVLVELSIAIQNTRSGTEMGGRALKAGRPKTQTGRKIGDRALKLATEGFSSAEKQAPIIHPRLRQE
jgi:hypothetical protein